MQKRRKIGREANIAEESINDIGKAFGDDIKGKENGSMPDVFLG